MIEGTAITCLDEYEIACAIIDEALGRQCAIMVFDGEEHVLRRGVVKEEILKNLAHTGMDRLGFYRDGKPIGWVDLVWGNGSCLISDYTVNDWTRAILDRAERLQDQIDERDEAAGA